MIPFFDSRIDLYQKPIPAMAGIFHFLLPFSAKNFWHQMSGLVETLGKPSTYRDSKYPVLIVNAGWSRTA
jgi:hypothetical protein